MILWPVRKFIKRRFLSWLVRTPLGVTIAFDVAKDKAIALTFDDGPNPNGTPSILDTLEAFRAKATFFLLGRNVDTYPHIAAEIARRGHAIGCHTYNHVRLVGLKTAQIVQEIKQSQRSILRATGTKPRLFRPPYGAYDSKAYFILRAFGMKVILWSAGGEDWLEHDSGIIVQRVLEGLSNGACVFLHDGSEDFSRQEAINRSNTIAATRTLLRVLSEQGYQFLTVPEMMRYRERRVFFRYWGGYKLILD